EGVRVFARTVGLRLLLLINVVVATGTALVLVNSVVYIKSVFALDDSALAVSFAAFGLGSLLVALNIPALVTRFGVIPTMLSCATVVTAGLAGALVVTLFAVAGAG